MSVSLILLVDGGGAVKLAEGGLVVGGTAGLQVSGGCLLLLQV